jgi:hypothetical protein
MQVGQLIEDNQRLKQVSGREFPSFPLFPYFLKSYKCLFTADGESV